MLAAVTRIEEGARPGTIGTQELQDLLQTTDLQEAVDSLLHTALLRGAPDNVTLVSVECSDCNEGSLDGTRVYPTS